MNNKFISCLFAILLLAACKKDSSGGSSGKLLIARTYSDGLLSYELIYSTERKIIRVNNYVISGGQSKPGIYRLYEYNKDGTVQQVMQYNSSHTPTARRVYTYNTLGKITRIDEANVFSGGDDLDVMDFFDEFEYNGKGQLIEKLRRKSDFAVVSRTDYAYDDQGNLVLEEVYQYNAGQYVLQATNEIVPDNRTMPDHWKDQLVVPSELNWYMLYAKSRIYTYWGGQPTGDVNKWTYTNQEYNSQGYVTRQTHSVESGDPNGTVYTYEYVQ